MHSLNPDDNNVSLSCCSIANPTNNGYELSPSNNLSHKWNILFNGKTSENIRLESGTIAAFFIHSYLRENMVKNHGIANNSGTKLISRK